ncbi:MAG: adenosine deaminase [Pseudobutyrivibrio sp.]|nr:adenosine deaminase [Pseudobutyrivibrio sp.]
MSYFGKFYLDKEKDIVINLYMDGNDMSYVLQTPYHETGNLITNLAVLCDLPISFDENNLKVIKGQIPCYIDDRNRSVYVLRLGSTKVANIYPDGTIERKASIPAISKILMSQTKDYKLDFKQTLVKTYILNDCKFRTDLHTHMNANLDPDVLIALGINRQILYPNYYIKKLGLRVSDEQKAYLASQRKKVAKEFKDSPLTGKYLDRKIDDKTYINFADFILNNIENAAYNIPKIRASLSIMKDGQAVFTNLEKVYLYRYVFAKGIESKERISLKNVSRIPDGDICRYLNQMISDSTSLAYKNNTLYQDTLLWIARTYQSKGIRYAEISDTTLVKPDGAPAMLAQVHEIMPKIMEETGVVLRFLAAIRRIPLTIVRDQVGKADYARENLQVLKAVAVDPYVAGSDIIGEEINDIRELEPVIKEIVNIAASDPSYVIRVHAGENDSLRDNVENSIKCVKESLKPNQPMPNMRVGHGLYTANLNSEKGKRLIAEIKNSGVVLEFQISSNVRLNNLSDLNNHPLKKYLKEGVLCVQGTDGGALYGTDSIDEELSLEKLLNLSHSDLVKMHKAEEVVEKAGMEGFRKKQKNFCRLLKDGEVKDFFARRIEKETVTSQALLSPLAGLDSAEALGQQVEPLPADKIPFVIAGGSFNSDKRTTSMREDTCKLLDGILKNLDAKKYFLVIGHKISGYEKYVLEKNAGKFEVYAYVPSLISQSEYQRIKKSKLKVRIAIEPTGMGTYKSYAYEIFKRRSSVLLALDGNSAGANMIQEAKNSRGNCRIYVSSHCRQLAQKAKSLEGYVTIFKDEDFKANALIKDVEKKI